MYKILLTLFMISSYEVTTLSAQKTTKVYTTKFTPKENFYFVSGGHNQCIAAVSYGIEIKTDTVIGFFRMDYRETEKLKKIIGDAEVQIEVSIFDRDLEGNGTLGEVLKITLSDVVLYKRK